MCRAPWSHHWLLLWMVFRDFSCVNWRVYAWNHAFVRIFAGFWGAMRTETRRNGTSNMLEFSARIRHVSAYMPVTLTDGVKKLVLEGVARAKYDSDCCFLWKAERAFGGAWTASVPRPRASCEHSFRIARVRRRSRRIAKKLLWILLLWWPAIRPGRPGVICPKLCRKCFWEILVNLAENAPKMLTYL